MASKSSIPEEYVLKPAPEDEDEWPEILLTHVEVYDADEGQRSLRNLLSADEQNPVSLVGRIERLAHGQQQLCEYSRFYQLRNDLSPDGHVVRSRDLLPASIQVEGITRWSYGQFDDGQIGFWAAGKAGWFEIRPARSYRSIYAEMTEAIQALYFVADLYQGKKIKQFRQVTADSVFTQYADVPSHGCADEAEAATIFLRHRDVLLDLMGKGKEGVKWGNTPIHEYLEEHIESDADDETESATPRTNLSDFDDAPARLAIKGKSAMRPRSGKYSGKGKHGAQVTSEDDDEDTPMTDEVARAESPLKRKGSSTRPGRPAKRRSAGSSSTILLQPKEQSEDSEGDGTLPLKDTPHHAKGGSSNERFQLFVSDEQLPSLEPNADGIWHCPYDGCDHKVYNGGTDEAKALTREHLQQHAFHSQEQLDLVYSEQRPYLPVGNLAKKIRELAALNKLSNVSESKSSIPETFPKPISSRY